VTAPKAIKLDPVWKIDQQRVQKYLKARVAPRVFKHPTDARLVMTKAGFEKKEEKTGVQLDVESTASAVAERIPESGAEPVLIITLKQAQPKVTLADLDGIDEEIARFRTSHAGSGNRAENIMLACSKINGTVLRPGDLFSYNRVVGPREREHGYKIAPVISEGRLIPGMAGGVCQTSSTLYNAVLLADLKIVRRSHHTFPVHYLPAGRDATVAYGSIDFQFQNSLDGPIAIMADGSRGEVVMRIFGRKSPGKQVQVVSSRSGLNATVWRTVKQDGQQIRREQVSRDHYQPAPPKEPARRRDSIRRTASRQNTRAHQSRPVRIDEPPERETAIEAPTAPPTTEAASVPTP
jgi:vancomycin resistance protein YoaR